MMHKHRGADAHTGEPHHGKLTGMSAGVAVLLDDNGFECMVKADSLRRFTGLHDTNGNGIYDGNEVSWIKPNPVNGVVRYCDVFAAYVVEFGDYDIMLHEIHTDIEVIT